MINNSEIFLLSGADVLAVLNARETDILQVVRTAYEAHAAGDSVVPHSLFLRLNGHNGDRGIALPAYLGGALPLLGARNPIANF